MFLGIKDASGLIQYLVYIQHSTIVIKLCVERIQHVDYHHWSTRSTDGGKSHYVAKQHSDVIYFGWLDRLP